jgi:hypothetical protein
LIELDPDVVDFTDDEVCKAVKRETRKIMDFWNYNSAGWAPKDVSDILARSMLEWQSSLAEALAIWLNGNSEDELILAWANLGALVEGLLKLFLCVYLRGYRKAERVWTRNGQLGTPDGEMLNNLQKFFADEVWTAAQRADWDPWIERIRKRRNSIHAFRQHEIGSFEEWRQDLKIYLLLLRNLDSQMPYP